MRTEVGATIMVALIAGGYIATTGFTITGLLKGLMAPQQYLSLSQKDTDF